jgi:hypothetical protein
LRKKTDKLEMERASLFMEIEKLIVMESQVSALEIEVYHLWEELKTLSVILGANEEID